MLNPIKRNPFPPVYHAFPSDKPPFEGDPVNGVSASRGGGGVSNSADTDKYLDKGAHEIKEGLLGDKGIPIIYKDGVFLVRDEGDASKFLAILVGNHGNLFDTKEEAVDGDEFKKVMNTNYPNFTQAMHELFPDKILTLLVLEQTLAKRQERDPFSYVYFTEVLRDSKAEAAAEEFFSWMFRFHDSLLQVYRKKDDMDNMQNQVESGILPASNYKSPFNAFKADIDRLIKELDQWPENIADIQRGKYHKLTFPEQDVFGNLKKDFDEFLRRAQEALEDQAEEDLPTKVNNSYSAIKIVTSKLNEFLLELYTKTWSTQRELDPAQSEIRVSERFVAAYPKKPKNGAILGHIEVTKLFFSDERLLPQLCPKLEKLYRAHERAKQRI